MILCRWDKCRCRCGRCGNRINKYKAERETNSSFLCLIPGRKFIRYILLFYTNFQAIRYIAISLQYHSQHAPWKWAQEGSINIWLFLENRCLISIVLLLSPVPAYEASGFRNNHVPFLPWLDSSFQSQPQSCWGIWHFALFLRGSWRNQGGKGMVS